MAIFSLFEKAIKTAVKSENLDRQNLEKFEKYTVFFSTKYCGMF